MATRTGRKISPVSDKVKEELKVAKSKTATPNTAKSKTVTRSNTGTSFTAVARDKSGKVVEQRSGKLTPVTREEFVGEKKWKKEAHPRKTRSSRSF